MNITQEQRALTGAIVEKVQDVDWDGDITPFIENIVSVIANLVGQDPGFAAFAQDIHDQAVKWALAAWSENLVTTLADSGWSKLSAHLKQFIPTAD